MSIDHKTDITRDLLCASASV